MKRPLFVLFAQFRNIDLKFYFDFLIVDIGDSRVIFKFIIEIFVDLIFQLN